MAIVMPFLFGIDLIAFDIRPASEVVMTYWGMLLGDFLGCFLVLASVLVVFRSYRTFRSASRSNRH